MLMTRNLAISTATSVILLLTMFSPQRAMADTEADCAKRKGVVIMDETGQRHCIASLAVIDNKPYCIPYDDSHGCIHSPFLCCPGTTCQGNWKYSNCYQPGEGPFSYRQSLSSEGAANCWLNQQEPQELQEPHMRMTMEVEEGEQLQKHTL
ncbi:MAG: hypothetical protein J3R72DRAFT_451496 [Linnemannia gamsii]|nr:MAG: hypothetical protein J3R72DRAFT_451496 [Linnemannia gamsii]